MRVEATVRAVLIRVRARFRAAPSAGQNGDKVQGQGFYR